MPRKKKEYKPKYFPFSSGIPWKIDHGKYVIPEISYETWHRVLDGKDIIITAFGGLIESFFSLSVAESIVTFDPKHNMYWLGYSKYDVFARMQGLVKPSLITFPPETLKEYPVPLFFDADNNAYFNVLNNYLVRTSYWGQYPELRTAPILKQISENSMIPWNMNIPQMRHLGTEFYDELCTVGRLRNRSKVILIILDTTDSDVLGWNTHNIREFSQLIASKGFKVIVFCQNTIAFQGSKILAFEYDIRKILQMINVSWMVLSNSIQWLLISMILSDVKIVSRQVDGPFDLFENADFIGAQNDIFTDRKFFSPVDVFTICEGLI